MRTNYVPLNTSTSERQPEQIIHFGESVSVSEAGSDWVATATAALPLLS